LIYNDLRVRSDINRIHRVQRFVLCAVFVWENNKVSGEIVCKSVF
jgi:hypothetical protein